MSLGISPTPATSFPSPPHTAGSLPRGGGILLNKSSDDAARSRRISEPASPGPLASPSGSPSPTHEKSAPLLSPLDVGAAQQLSASASGSGTGGGSAGGTTPRIRFAPLPDPTRPRSSSAGTDPAWAGAGDAGGGDGDGRHQTVVVTDVKGYDNALESEDDDDDDEAREKRSRRWSKSMTMGMGSVDWGSGWKGTKKILTMGLMGDDEEEGYSNGAPLKKSVSTGGFIGSSPFRWTAETERKKTMLGSSPGSASSSLLSPHQAPAHRRGSSLETSNQLGTSPAKPVKLLNGRVYGGRRASEAAEAEKRRREQNEPEFIEWGAGKSGGGIGSNQPVSRSGEDDDDGSGMEWVRKRRERREREERERREKESGSAGPNTEVESGEESDPPSANKRPLQSQHQASSSQSSASSNPSPKDSRSPVTPSLNLSELPPTPIIQISEHLTPSVSAPAQSGPALTPIAEMQGSKPSTPIGIALRDRPAEHDVFDEDDDKGKGESSDEEGDTDEEEEGDEDGDFSEDEEEEEEVRTTSTAAGVEKVSRHREQVHSHSQPSTPSIDAPAPPPVSSSVQAQS